MNNFENYLAQTLQEIPESPVKEAMLYSLMAGGKRVRPALLFAGLNAYGIDESKGYAAAAAIEMIHTYSLIHDDLPAMDNDTMRRGKPTCHIAFDEATAILAGDALLTQAFVEIGKASNHVHVINQLVMLLATYSGAQGMVLGQSRDLQAESKPATSLDDLKAIHLYKTGKLLTLPLLFACCIADRYHDHHDWETIGMQIGLAFQIQDDVLDVTASSEQLGKSNSDVTNDKATYVKFMGIEEAKAEVKRLLDDCKDRIKALQLHDEVLIQFIDQIAKREN